MLDVAALQPYVLYVGAPEWRKGFDVLQAAMARVTQQRPELRLVATSELGYVDDATLAALYRGCLLLAFPSRYEGFGLPVLEAMSYGAPVVASDASAVPEAGGDAACYFESGDDAALAGAILRVAGDAAYADGLRRRGFARAGQFSWQRTAELTLEVVERTLI